MSNKKIHYLFLLFYSCFLLNTVFAKDISLEDILLGLTPSLDFYCDIRMDSNDVSNSYPSLQISLFSSIKRKSITAIITNPCTDQGTSLLIKDQKASIYYPAIEEFVEINPDKQITVLSPFAFLFIMRSWLNSYNLVRIQGDDSSSILFLESKDVLKDTRKIKLWYNNKDGFIEKEEYFNNKDILTFSVYYEKWTLINQNLLPVKWSIIQETGPYFKLFFEVLQYKPSLLPDFVFTRSYIEFITQ